ncbi:Apolipoprotein N-acyltransferase [Sulfurivirga caldicuralii]|uniref:Apolipoprotein N-acyltransferase n=1 Tax=Sulfurivirga caldicuralii TaxID=364032 RepID=A0A1N6GFA7_9GAMM|nr:apolipoprotein N-acyltransferase [Sulfurivirga caldicuralii]SIO06215.1 Apolipoprotein N-acyltransferase [Sulfurivirga caldicuralii]
MPRIRQAIKHPFQWFAAALRPDRQGLAAAAFGAMAAFAFAPFSFAPLALLAQAGLFWLWLKTDTSGQAARLGLWFGLGLHAVGSSWLYSSLYVYGQTPLWLTLISVALWVLYLSLFPALAGWIARIFFSPRFPVISLLTLFPAAWVLSELIKQHLFGGFPFLQMGTSHVLTWLDGYAPVFGGLGVSWALALSAAALVWLVRNGAWMGAAFIFAVVWLGGGLLQDIKWTQPVGDPVDVALLQGNIPQDKKWQPDQFMPTLKRYIKMTRENLGADVIVWPETAVPAFFDLVERGALKTFIRDARLIHKPILVGSIWRDVEKRRYYNALINVGSDPYQVYRKYHLVLIGEYYPFSDWLKPLFDLWNIPFDQFSPGPFPPEPMKLGDHHAGMAICFETMFGHELAAQLPQADYFITVSNDAWFAHTLEPAQALQDVQMRAIELGRPFARATNTGYTAVVDHNGHIVKQLAPYKQGALRATLQPRQGMTPFARWKELPVLLLLLLVFGVVLGDRYLRRAV